MSISIFEVIAAACDRSIPLTGDTAGHLVFSIAEQIAIAPRVVSPENILLLPEGAVRVHGGGTAEELEAERALRALLLGLLRLSSGANAALQRVATRQLPAHSGSLGSESVGSGSQGLQHLVRELEAALIPFNRAAARRSLARLFRETQRAEAAGCLNLNAGRAWLEQWRGGFYGQRVDAVSLPKAELPKAELPKAEPAPEPPAESAREQVASEQVTPAEPVILRRSLRPPAPVSAVEVPKVELHEVSASVATRASVSERPGPIVTGASGELTPYLGSIGVTDDTEVAPPVAEWTPAPEPSEASPRVAPVAIAPEPSEASPRVTPVAVAPPLPERPPRKPVRSTLKELVQRFTVAGVTPERELKGELKRLADLDATPIASISVTPPPVAVGSGEDKSASPQSEKKLVPLLTIAIGVGGAVSALLLSGGHGQATESANQMVHVASPSPRPVASQARSFASSNQAPRSAASQTPQTLPRQAPQTLPRQAPQTLPRQAPQTQPRQAPETVPRQAAGCRGVLVVKNVKQQERVVLRSPGHSSFVPREAVGPAVRFANLPCGTPFDLTLETTGPTGKRIWRRIPIAENLLSPDAAQAGELVLTIDAG